MNIGDFPKIKFYWEMNSMIRIAEKIVSKIPKREFNGEKAEKFISWFGRNISTPENRLIIGASALASQPFIDLFNNDVDEDTRIVSCARTIGKTVAGTATGFLVRAGFIHLTRKYSEVGEVGTNKIKKLFTPPNAPSKVTFAYKQYQNAMGMLLAIVAMLFTNFAIDAPLTNYLTNNLTDYFKGVSAKDKKKNAGEVLDAKI